MAQRVDKSKMACNQPKRTPSHPTKSHVVKACSGGKEKVIRFGQQGVRGAGKSTTSEKDKARKRSYYARHNAQDPNPSKMSARYWSHKVKWTIAPIGIMLILSTGEEAHAKLQSEGGSYLSTVQYIEDGSR